jgi:ribosome biogenesis protein Nip4
MDKEIDQFTSQFTSEKIEDIMWISDECYRADKGLQDASNKIVRAFDKRPYAIGTFLGKRGKRGFAPSIALIDIVAAKTDKTAMIDDHSAWLFLCGRDVFGKSVLSSNATRGLVIVINKKKEVLGYGEIVNPLHMNETVVIKNKLDRGDFLRREMTKGRK